MALVARRLPGVRVDVAPPPSAEALPRMDVAVFVGFASMGPLHEPVVVESVAQFSAVFGGDASLAWDPVRGERVLAHLGPAVRAFFSNGGSRCWVIRVARSAAGEAIRTGASVASVEGLPGVAASNVFTMPGVLAIGAMPTEPARADARCEGSWSDGIQLASALVKRSFALEAYHADDSPPTQAITFRTRFRLAVGDLIELGDTGDAVIYAAIDRVRSSGDPGGSYEVGATVSARFERVAVTSPSATPVAVVVDVAGFASGVPAVLTPTDAGHSSLQLQAPVPATLEAGHWARCASPTETLWLRMDEIAREAVFTGASANAAILATVTGPAWRELPIVAASTIVVQSAHQLTLDIRATLRGSVENLSEIGLTREHARAWWSNISDAEFHRSANDVGALPRTTVPAASRFSLSRATRDDSTAWLPLGVDALPRTAIGARPVEHTALERDGLSAFSASLFMDPELEHEPLSGIVERADTIRYIRPEPRALLGMHAALSIGAGGSFGEVSLLALPDAVHRGWARRPHEDPEAVIPRKPTTPGHWRTHRGPCAVPGNAPLVEPDFSGFLDCDTRELRTPDLRGPLGIVAPGRYRLTWDASDNASEYVLSESTQPDLSDAREIYRGADTEYVALTEREGTYYYQVFAAAGDDRSDTSAPAIVQIRRDDWVVTPEEASAELVEAEWLAAHRAALRMAAATGDLFVTLAMPRHFRAEHAQRYAERLRAVRGPLVTADAQAFVFAESRALSYGSLYFPWLQANRGGATVDVPRAPRIVPPDGAAMGVLAARASRRGAWIAPANEPLKDVVALSPVIEARDWQPLQDAQINLIRQDSRGLISLSADTLSWERDLRPINVRRLMILLRRLAMRRGSTYVFEPNGPTLRRAVQRSFDELLTALFRRGAFAGRTAAQAFRVVTDDTLNTRNDRDAGRFFVELRVAPAVPLRFLAIRLAQSGERLTVVEEL